MEPPLESADPHEGSQPTRSRFCRWTLSLGLSLTIAATTVAQPPELLDSFAVPPGVSAAAVALTGAGDGTWIVLSTYPDGPLDTDPYLMQVNDAGDILWLVEDSAIMDAGSDVAVSGGLVYMVGGPALERYTLDGQRLDWILTPALELNAVIPDNEGGVVAAGSQGDALFIARYDDTGSEQWQVTYHGGVGDWWRPSALRSLPDGGGYVVVGRVMSFGAGVFTDALSVFVSSDGEVLGHNLYGMGAWNTAFTDVVPLPDGSQLFSGNRTIAGDPDEIPVAYAMRTDADGIAQWQTTLDDMFCSRTASMAPYQGGVLISGGHHPSDPGAEDGMLWYVLEDGSVYWEEETSTYPLLDLLAVPDESLRLLARGPTTTIQVFGPGRMIELSLLPDDPPILIPSGGGSFSYQATLQNPSSLTFQGGGVVMVTLPSGTQVGPLLTRSVFLLPGQTVQTTMEQTVPGSAPAGIYHYRAHLGVFGGGAFTVDGFEFEKLDGGADIPRVPWSTPSPKQSRAR